MIHQSWCRSRLAPKVGAVNKWAAPSRRVPVAMRVGTWDKTTTSTQYYRLVSTRTWGNYGSNTFHLRPPRASTLSICKMNWIKSCRKDRLERQVFAQSVKSCTHKRSTKLYVKLPLTALNVASSWSELEMRSKWQFRLIRPSTRVPSPTVWEKHCKPSRIKLRCLSKYRILKTSVLTSRTK